MSAPAMVGPGPGLAANTLLRSLLALVLSVGMVGAIVGLLGYSPTAALSALITGSLGSPAALTATLLKTGPLLLTGLAVALCFRCGVWNIGAEGQLYAGALAASAVATVGLPSAPGYVVLPALVMAGALAGAGWGAIAGVLRAHRGVSEVISTILLNFVAIQLVSLAVHGPLQEASGAYPQGEAFTASARLPALGRLHLGIPVSALLAAACAFLLFRTATGFRMRAVGLSPLAARFAGIVPERQLLLTITGAGALAGLAGAFEVSGVTGRLYETLSPGYGYTAIAVALVARLHPMAVVPAAFFFGMLEAGGGAMQRSAGVPAVAGDVVKGVVILLSIALATVGAGGRRGGGAGASAQVEAGVGSGEGR